MFSEHQKALGKPEQAVWRELLEEFSQLVSDFIEASRNLIWAFLHKKTEKRCENHQRSHKKYCYLLGVRTLLIFISWLYPFKYVEVCKFLSCVTLFDVHNCAKEKIFGIVLQEQYCLAFSCFYLHKSN